MQRIRRDGDNKMSSSTLLKVGDAVPIALQIADGNEIQFPQAEVYDNNGLHLITLSLSHSGDGLYQPSTPYLMPNKFFIQVVYIVYSNAGHTTESLVYLRDVDSFVKIDVDEFKADVSILATETNATSNKDSIITQVNGNETKIDVVLVNQGILNGKLNAIQTETDKIPAMIIDLDFLEDVEGGDWERIGSQMIFSEPGGGAEIARFNLFKFDGSPADESDEVARRVRV